jgi:serine/threonine protein kinase
MAFRDALGERRVTKDPTGAGVEALCVRRELAAVPSFEFALRERITRLGGFRHAYYGRIRGVERSNEFDQALTILSDLTPGIRLSALLDTAHEQRLTVDLDVALCLIRQLVPAVAILHETAREASHGAIGPERLIVTPNGRLVIVEYVLGSALEQLLFTRERYWTELRVALPRVAGLPRFDHLADVTQVGVVALSLILGRTLRDEEYPARIGEVVASAMAINAQGESEPLPAGLRNWLQRALQLDARSSFPSAIEARAEFERVLADSGYDASPASLERFMSRHHAHATSIEIPRGVMSAAPVRIAVPVGEPSQSSPRASSVPLPLPLTPQPAPVPVNSGPAPAVLASQATPVKQVIPAMSATSPVLSVPTPPPLAHKTAAVDEKARDPKPAPPPSRSPSVESKTAPNRETVEIPNAPLDDDDVELEAALSPKPARRSGGKIAKIAAVAAVAVVTIGAVALVGARRFWSEVPTPPTTGTLVVTTNPAGAEAFVDGVRRGSTPVTLQLLAGSHNIELRGSGEPRVIPITIAPGQQVAQYVDLPAIQPPVEAHAEVTPPLPAPVIERASAEATLNGPGWIAVSGNLEMQLFEDGHLLGTSKIERIMVPAGRHNLEMVNELIGYRTARAVLVSPGKVTTVALDVPKGSMAINALPWAEVWMDGAKIGETPIGSFAVSVGSHDVVFRHPELGEQRETVLVTLKNPVRLSVDMRKP